MGSLAKRLLEFIPASVRHLVPLNGIFASGWTPASALAVYWFESVLLAAIAVILCALLKRRTSDRAIAEARAAGDLAYAAEIAVEADAARKAGVDPSAVFAFHVGSLMVFGLFLGGVLLMLTLNGRLAQPFEWTEFRSGASMLLLVIGAGFAIELTLFPEPTVAAIQSRVQACLGRWALLWLLGFGGTLLMMATGRAGAFLAFFAILKVVWETWGTLARMLGWKSLQERAQEAR